MRLLQRHAGHACWKLEQVLLQILKSNASVTMAQVVADWRELQHLTGALRQWRMLPDFSCQDEATRIGAPALPCPAGSSSGWHLCGGGLPSVRWALVTAKPLPQQLAHAFCPLPVSPTETYLDVVKQTTSKMALGSAEAQKHFASAGVPWSPDLLQPLRRTAMQPAKLYMERVLREAPPGGGGPSACAAGLALTRAAVRLASQVRTRLPRAIFLTPDAFVFNVLETWILLIGLLLWELQVQQFTGGLDRDCSVLLKRVQNLQATIQP